MKPVFKIVVRIKGIVTIEGTPYSGVEYAFGYYEGKELAENAMAIAAQAGMFAGYDEVALLQCIDETWVVVHEWEKPRYAG